MVPLFQVDHFTPCPLNRRGWLLTRLRLDAKRRSPPCCRHAGLLCAPSLGDARRDGEKVSPEVGLDDSRKARGRASGGAGGETPSHAYWRGRGLTAPKQAASKSAGSAGSFSSHGPRKRWYGSRRPMTAARSIPRRWGRFSGQIRASGGLLARGVLSLP